MVRGLPQLEQVEQVRDSYLAGKQRSAAFPEQARHRANNILDLVYCDLCDPIMSATPSGNQYFLLLVDDMSRFMWLQLLSSKDQAPSFIMNFQAAIEVESGHKLKVLCTDGGGGVHLCAVWAILCGARRPTAAHHSVHSPAEWSG
jgi:hypothetical protein